MTTEFNLKEERKKLFKKYRLLDGCKKMILEQDKEFIRLLNSDIRELEKLTAKECELNIEDVLINPDMVREIIEYRAGYKLIENNKTK